MRRIILAAVFGAVFALGAVAASCGPRKSETTAARMAAREARTASPESRPYEFEGSGATADPGSARPGSPPRTLPR